MLFFGQQFLDKVFAFVGNGVPNGVIETYVFLFQFLFYYFFVFAAKWRNSSNANMRKNTQTPNVALFAVEAFIYFRSCVAGLTPDFCQLMVLII